MKVLITGSSGIIGRALVDDFIARKIRVIGVDKKDNPDQIRGEYFNFYQCCISDREYLRYIFSNEQPTHVIHLACSLNKIRNRKRESYLDVGGSCNILELSNETSTVKQLIYSSSATAYGGYSTNSLWLNEKDPARPGKFRYGINKKMVEQSFTDTLTRDDLHLITLRLCSVVGPTYDKPKTTVSLLIRLPFLPKFYMENKVQFIHTSDIINLMHLIMKDDGIEGIFNMAPDTYSVIKEVLPDKKYVNFPLAGLKAILWTLWNLRLLNLQPSGVSNSIHPIILDPSKLTSRYSYKFKYSSSEAFLDTVRNNMLPPDSRF